MTKEVKKDLFIENWHVEPFYNAKWFAKWMTNKEDLYVFEQWKAKSINYSSYSLDFILSTLNNIEEMIILTVNLGFILLKKQLLNYKQKITYIKNGNFRQSSAIYTKNGI